MKIQLINGILNSTNVQSNIQHLKHKEKQFVNKETKQ